uniref:thiamine phosphate synthase n=2 Tax=Sphingomonas sp. GlSt437 TaxID=3389970 RepID=UPI003A8746FC
MPRRYPRKNTRLPRLWLMTDERMDERLWAALERLPRGAGIVFRHYSLAPAERRALFKRVAAIAARRRLVLIRAGAGPLGQREAGTHGRGRRSVRGLRTWPAHNRREVIAGIRAGADLILISPIFATQSHPGARPLSRVRALMLAQRASVPVIALGGVDRKRGKALIAAGFYGWASIDAWL